MRRVITSYLSIYTDIHQKYKTAGVPENNANLMRNANRGTPSGMRPGEWGDSTPRKIGWGPTARFPQSLLYL